MSEVARITGYEVAPAVFDREWLPDVGLWAELSRSRAEVERLRQAKEEAGGVSSALRARLDTLTQERAGAMEQSFRQGGDGSVDGFDEQIAALRIEADAASERHQAAVRVWVEEINAAVALVAERRAEWLGDLDGHDAIVDVEISDLMRQLRDAQSRRGSTARLRHWVDRTGGEAASLPGMHIQFTAIPIAAPQAAGIGEDSSAHDQWKQDHMAANYAGPKATPITSVEQARLQEEEDLAAEAAELRAQYESGEKRRQFEALGGKVA